MAVRVRVWCGTADLFQRETKQVAKSKQALFESKIRRQFCGKKKTPKRRRQKSNAGSVGLALLPGMPLSMMIMMIVNGFVSCGARCLLVRLAPTEQELGVAAGDLFHPGLLLLAVVPTVMMGMPFMLLLLLMVVMIGFALVDKEPFHCTL